jgi:hypothetical protein
VSYRGANSMSYDDVIDRAAGPFEPAQHLGIDP